MSTNAQNTIELLVLVCVFGFVLSLWLIGACIWAYRRSSRAQLVEKRLGMHEQDASKTRTLRLWKDGEEATTTVPYRTRESFIRRWQRLTQQAGWQAPLATIAFGLLGAMVLFFGVAVLVSNNIVFGLTAAAAPVIFYWYLLQGRLHRRLLLFERQFIDALELAARSLRAGHPLIGSFRLVSEEISQPVGPVFGEICQRQAMGAGLDDAILDVSSASGSLDMQLFATSVVIQMRSGGNLADMMDRLAYVIRDRLRLSRRVRVLTAQTQLSKRILFGLPFVLFLLLNLLNPEYMRPLYTTSSGRTLLLGATIGISLGAWVMNRLAVLRY